MKGYFKFCLPFLIAGSSLISCGNSAIKITLNAGLGYFVDPAEFAIEASPSNSVAYVEKTFIVSEGTSFKNFNYPLPSLCNNLLDFESIYQQPLFWTNENNEIVKETDVFKSNTTLTAHYCTSVDEIKSVGMGVYTQALTGALKRCVLTGKPTECLLKFSNFMDFEFANTSSPFFYLSLGKTGAAISDALGETQQYDAFASISMLMFNQMSTINNHCASNSGTFFQATIGAIKRILLYRPDAFNLVAWENYIRKSISAIIEAGPTKAAYLCKSLAALSDEIGEMGKEADPMQLELNDFIYQAFIKVKDVPQGLAIGRATSAFIGQLKRMLMNNLDVENFIRDYKNKINILLTY